VIPKNKFFRNLLRVLTLLILTIASGYWHLYQNQNSTPTTNEAAIAPVIPSFHLEKAKPQPPASEPENIVTNIPIGKNQTFGQLMGSLGFDPLTTQEICEKTRVVYNLNQIRAGKSLVVVKTPENDFSRLEYCIDPTQKLIVKKDESGVEAEMQTYTPDVQVRELGGEIQGSLYNSINRIGEGDELVSSFADIFEWDVDFFKDLQPGDTFRIIYEKQTIQGQDYGYGKILAAQLINKGREYSAIGYQHGKNWEYFSSDGKAMKKAFLAAPLKFSRISSGFTSSRYHPILHAYRAHLGIDYAAPVGTPVRAIGKGVVTLAGWGGGGGKTIKIQHSKEITTQYCHLSKFAPGIRNGASVSQGQVIGYVGSTGLSTGPHLDFRFMKNGKYVNFLTVKGQQAEPLSSSEFADFKAATKGTAAKLQAIPISEPQPEIASSTNGLQFNEETL